MVLALLVLSFNLFFFAYLLLLLKSSCRSYFPFKSSAMKCCFHVLIPIPFYLMKLKSGQENLPFQESKWIYKMVLENLIMVDMWGFELSRLTLETSRWCKNKIGLKTSYFGHSLGKVGLKICIHFFVCLKLIWVLLYFCISIVLKPNPKLQFKP